MSGIPKRLLASVIILLAMICTVLLQSESYASANTITVNSLADSASPSDGLCTLREAIINANNAGSDQTSGDCATGSGIDTINFSLSGTITLGSALPEILNFSPDSLTIDASDQNVTLDGNSLFRIFSDNTEATVTLKNLTLAYGYAGDGASGGAIFNSGNLTVVNSTFFQNFAPNGGGAIINGGTLIASGSTFSGNSASTFGGGAILEDGGTESMTNCTFSGNFTLPFASIIVPGGAISNQDGTITVTNSTFAANYVAPGVVVLTPPVGGIYMDNGTVTLVNSILTSNSSDNCDAVGSGVFINGGHNISGDATCGLGTSTSASGKTIGDNIDPLLAVAGLQDNGGPTQTIALQSTSRAINGIPKALCPAADQRGALRPATGHTACTIGAFEYAGVIPVPILTIAPTSLGFLTVGIGTTKSLTLTIKNTAKGGTLTGNVPTLAAPFNVTVGSGAFSLAAGQVRSVTVQFTPTTPIAVTTNLLITSNDPKKPSVTVKVTGTGQAGQLSVPSTLTFFTKATVPKIGTLTIRNLGLGVLHGNVGDSTGPFVVTAGSGAFTLNHLQTKVVSIQFTPPAKGPSTGLLPLLSDDPKHLSFNVNLKGTRQ